MQMSKREYKSRFVLTIIIFLSGFALLPFIDTPVTAVNWKLLAGIYAPDLNVNEDSGAPGSVFAFTGSGYPPNSTATIYVNGTALGTVAVGADGTGSFLIDTTGAALGIYTVTMEVDINASATEDFELTEDDDIVSAPPGFSGPIFTIHFNVYLPAIQKP